MEDITSVVPSLRQLYVTGRMHSADARSLRSYTPVDDVYTDPLISVRGRDAIDQFVGAAQAQFAGLRLSSGSTGRTTQSRARCHDSTVSV